MSFRISTHVATDLFISGQTQGDVLYFNGTNWVRLPAGNDGEVLQTRGAGANPRWIGRTSNKVVGTTNNPTTTSATYAVIPQMTITATTNGGTVMMFFQGSFDLLNDDNLDISPFVDGVEVGSTHRLEMQFTAAAPVLSTASLTQPSTIVVPVTGLSAGSHTFDVRWRALAGTARSNLVQRVLSITEIF